jgi:hypothetical protein
MHQFKLNSSIYRIILLYGSVIAFNLMKIPFNSRWAVFESKNFVNSKVFLKQEKIKKKLQNKVFIKFSIKM